MEKKYKTNNPFEICSLANIQVVPWDLHEEINGFYKYDRRNKYIFINLNLSDDMQRFVCSHELGHVILHPRSNTPFLRKKTLFSVDKLEVEANTFAVELLMNDEKVYKFKDTNLSIREIAKIYGIPENVAYLKKL
ncbi:ImmA/IrrE family metallo-endopeptidase [Lentibacillus sp. CBA3610]|uniref:ImmA/IrrE family metallo-endopeptidase n=1 Tax=Lentibacillus sp. CBA3610 TaxID=2518176 RepID=UPI0015953BAB|nr:ImmA/IrrE family metallo-endopeptidase [Lentibacillus sp. CBA3610]QKY71636.1 ImmA/IrrE family metallo-endopeptidase [Lentibacillus sp. CBA3610]